MTSQRQVTGDDAELLSICAELETLNRDHIERVDALMTAAARLPARTLAGVRARARALELERADILDIVPSAPSNPYGAMLAALAGDLLGALA